MDREVDSYLRRKYESSIRDIEVVHKEDLDLVGGKLIGFKSCWCNIYSRACRFLPEQ